MRSKVSLLDSERTPEPAGCAGGFVEGRWVSGILATEDTIKNHPELIQSFLDAFHETQQSMLNGLSPADAASLKKLVGATMDDKVYNETISGLQHLFPESYVTSDASWDALRKVAEVSTQGTLNTPAADAVDNSFAEKVKK